SESDPSLGTLTIADDTLASLAAHDWPGNVRELRNVLDRAIYLARAAGETEVKLVTLPSPGPGAEAADVFSFHPEKSYRETRAAFEAELERRYVKWLLGRHAGNVSAAAREAQMDRKYLYDLAKRHGLRGRDDPED